jgi:uncharacterized protein (TIGR02569 family)
VDDVAEAEWVGDVLSVLVGDGFRINRPVRSGAGTWVVDGWSAMEWLAGERDRSGRWPEILRTAETLDTALGGLTRPAFLDARTDAWAVADRVACDEQPLMLMHDRLRPLAERLSAYVRPDDSGSQIIHGDLTGNVLLAPGLPPGVIDFTPYWRPRRFSVAVVVVDALLWHGAPPSLVAAVPGQDRASVVARAALYSLIASDRTAAVKEPEVADAYLNGVARDHRRVLHLLDHSQS